MSTPTMAERLHEAMKAALKAGQKDRLQVIRMVLSDVKNVDMNPQKPTEEQAVEQYAKKLKKSVEEYEKIGRTEEVAKLKSEIAVVEEFLPKKLDAATTEKLVDAYLASNSFTEKDMGKATGMFMKANKDVDAGIASGLLKKKLAGK